MNHNFGDHKKTELNLEEILAKIWSQGSPNGIMNTL